MKSRSSASLFLLCALIINNFTDSSACDFTVAVGSPVTINLGLDQTDELLWKHNSQRVFKGLVITAPTKLNNVKLTTDGSLIIHSVKMKDNGDHEFEVFLSNGKSKAKKSITLCVHEKLIKPTVDITCIDGTPSISCEVEDKTGLTFSWYKNEEKMDENSASLRNIERDQDYECAVEKPIPSEKSNKFRLSTTKYSSACDFTVAVGSPVTIKLGLDQTDELVWRHNSKRVFKGEVSRLPTKLNNAKVTSDGSLVISSVKKEDNGDHEFEAFLSSGRSKPESKKSVKLCVHEKPPKPTVDITCIDGIPSISCEVEDKTGLTFSWYKNEEKIDETSASLRNIERDQDYECAVEQPIPSEKSNKFRLSTTKYSSACDFTVAVGSTITIYLGVDETDELVWRHNSQRVFKGLVITAPTKLKNVKLTTDGSLIINSVKMEDNGDHEFEAFLSNGKSKAKKSITLCVYEKLIKPTVDITCINGIPSISCEVEDKTGLTFNWYKNEKKMDENSASLRNIERDQDYECAVEQPIPSEKSNKFRLSTTEDEEELMLNSSPHSPTPLQTQQT
ncbi:titin isoform X4 [Astyanax mexicanus]|uniref:titin isoform X4 n=1 Tax=Astyanax mexicanus TaxID=7994 RepID=UPI0020CAFEEF|nr:titin isoform X4 [Astyanax mexicanus]